MNNLKKGLLSVATLTLMQGSATAAFFVTPEFSTSAKTDLQYNDKLKSSKAGITLGNEYVSGGVALRTYDFSRKKDIDAKDVFVSGEYGSKIDNRLGYFVGGELDFSWDDDFSFSDSYNINAYGALTYDIGSNFTLIGGAGVYFTKPETSVYPLLMAKYRESSDLGLSFKVGFPANSLTYRFNDNFALVSKIDIYKSEPYVYLENFDNSRIDQFMLDRSNEASVAALFDINKNVSVTAGLAYAFDRKIKFYDKHGNKLASYEADDDGRLFISGTFTF